MDMKMGAPYKIKNKVVEFEQDRLIAWRHIGLHRWRYELTPTAAGGTRSPRPGTSRYVQSARPRARAELEHLRLQDPAAPSSDDPGEELKSAAETDTHRRLTAAFDPGVGARLHPVPRAGVSDLSDQASPR